MITTKENLTEENLAKEMDTICKRLDIKSIDEALRFPRYFQIETVRICNANCPFCLVSELEKSFPFMEDQLFDKIVDELSQYSDWVTSVLLQRGGEPLLDKKLVNRIKKLKRIGIKHVIFSTNASLLNEKKAVELLDSGLDEISFSIDSIIKEEYENLRRGLNFNTVMENIERFFHLRKEKKPDLVIRVRGVFFHNKNIDEELKKKERWENYWKKFTMKHDRVYMSNLHNWGNSLKIDKYSPRCKTLYNPCIMHWSTMQIISSGKVPYCLTDYDGTSSHGDLNKQSIVDVWQSDSFNQARNIHSLGKRNEIDFCKGCTIWEPDFRLEGKS